MANGEKDFDSLRFRNIIKRYEEAQLVNEDIYMEPEELTDIAEFYYYFLQEGDAVAVCLDARCCYVVVALGRLVCGKHLRRGVGQRIFEPAYIVPCNIGIVNTLGMFCQFSLHIAYLLFESRYPVRAVIA